MQPSQLTMKSHIVAFFFSLLLHIQHVFGTSTILDTEPGANETPTPTVSCSPSRSRWNIIVVCLTTIYLSTWTAIHPNVPGDRLTTRKRAWFYLFLRRLGLMVMAILLPEVTVAWAAAQFSDAWNLRHPETDVYTYVTRWLPGPKKDIPEPRLSWKHSFGIVMGLFYCGGSAGGQDSVSEDEDFVYLLTSEDLAMKKLNRPDDGALEDSEMIHDTVDIAAEVLQGLKNIRDDSIKDRSKSDITAKAITVIQLIWFITQCIGRHAQNLPITLLEISTLAIATLSIILSLLWMNKP
ncbi:hypothetical protein IW261DRAFT_1558667 [Armillaria novae-zelandiae]|uniref:Uncharacterized protein n=1 Tax=Armillaria novae-zelandiae TaxID=153914 RepID=A0AA39PP38_9AGAR|nr:hypothetical protein IW261DRAFT_1558667 [Armillaria novae-zelandiae]